jgi:putative sporulation protein YyaC
VSPAAARAYAHPIAATTIPPDHPAPAAALERALAAALVRLGADAGRPVVLACIGTDRATGDALGPLVGHALVRLGLDPATVVGTLERPLHAMNLDARLRAVEALRPRPVIVAVDAALGPAGSIGAIALRPGGLRPGQGLGRTLPRAGHLAITAVVAERADGPALEALQSARLFDVSGLAETIALACARALGAARAGARAA